MKRLLVALDGSSHAQTVLAQAVALARTTGAKLRLFRAVPVQPEIPWDMIRQFPLGGLQELLDQHARADLETLAKDVPAEHLDGIATGMGHPWKAICEAARAYDADLIVIGSHGHQALDHLLGTTTAKVVNHADRSVLVVRPPSAASSS
jgi:nucleotide-binding universal stress UspA family protein